MAGWNGSGGVTSPKKELPKAKLAIGKGVLAGLLVVVVAAIVAFVVFSGNKKLDEQKKLDRTQKRIASVEPARVEVKQTEETDPKKERIEKIKKMVAARGGAKNLTDADKREILAAVDGPRKPRPLPEVPPAHGNPYGTATDQVLAMAVSAGDHVPPLPGLEEDMERDMLKALEKPIVINDDDDEKTRAMKELVMATREEVQARLKKGESMRSILEAHRDMVNENTEIRADIEKVARELLESGDEEGMNLYLEKANKLLNEMGARPVDRPLTREERIEQLKMQKESIQ